jgi:hypothetical protein
MNTGNLQLEGLYLAIAALMDLLVGKGLLTTEEIDNALGKAEGTALDDPHLVQMSESNRDAVAFPIRLLRLSNQSSSGSGTVPFSELARLVGQTK